MATPADKEYGRKPSEFTDRKDYKKFMRELTTFLSTNAAKYDTDAKKISLVQSLCTSGTPEVWAQGKFETAYEQAVDGIIPDAAWGTFAAYLASLVASFKDPNDSRTAQNELAVLYPKKGQSMEEFFQVFDQLAQRAGHSTNDRILIELLEAKVPQSLLEQVYKDDPPDAYALYKAAVIRYDNLRRRFEAVRQITRTAYQHSHPSASSHTSSSTSHTKPTAPAHIPATKSNTGVTYGGRGQPMEIDRNKAKAEGKCYRCGEPGHIARSCPSWERGNTIRALFRDCEEDERTDLLEDFLGV
jgi:Zinc knuckle